MGGGPAQRLRAMALPEAARVSRMPSRRQRVERATTSIGKDGCKRDKPRSLRTNHRPAADDRARPTLQGRDRNRGRDRERSRTSRRSTRSRSRLPGDDPKKGANGTRPLDRASQDQPRCGVGERRHKRQSRGERRDIVGSVQRPSRRSDLQTQAGQAQDVWARKTRSPPSARHRRDVTSVIKSASEPLFNANPGSPFDDH